MLSDDDLIVAIENKTQEGAEALYDTYALLLFKVIYSNVHERQLAEEILEMTFYKIWNSFNEFHLQKNRLSIWIIGIGRNMSKLLFKETVISKL
jgi:DNA-directed RNA polymerase specialized sigma24 family protein